MGTSKAMMEKVFIAKSRNSKETLVTGTRYGNVMCSRGSVIPLFIEQIKKGEALTVTEPSMTRFIMSLDEAVELVLFSFKHAKAGDIMVQKSPACTVGDLAQAVKELLGVDNPIRHIGIRHGEKLYETLLTKEEAFVAEDMGGFYRVPADTRDLNYNKFFSEGCESCVDVEEYNSNNTQLLNVEEIKEKLLTLRYIKEEVAAWKNRN